MKRPLVFYAISAAVGCLSIMEFNYNSFEGVTIAVVFFIIYFTTLEKKFCCINILFYMLAVLSFLNYFNIDLKDNKEVRITQNKGYYLMGSVKGRKLVLNGNIKGLKEGHKIYIYGDFKSDKDYSKGIVGEYNIKYYKFLKNDILYYSYEYKRYIYNKFKNTIGENRTAVLMGICYGDTQYINSDQNMEFQKLGVVHAVSVSGFHMAILYKAFEGITGFKIAIIISAIYVIFTGMSAATMRSFIMILIFKMSKILFREYDGLSSLSLSALILMLVKPYYIVDVGFGLSFLATLGIILYYDRILRKFYILPKKLNEAISIDLSSQIYSMPYVAFTIQNFSYISIIGNLFLLPLYSAVVVLGNGALVVSFWKPVFNLLSKFIDMFLIACEGASSIMLKFSPDIVYLSYMDGVILLSLYTVCILYKSGYKRMKYLPVFMLLGIFLESFSFVTEITCLNFSKGESIIVSNGNTKVMICNYDSFSSKWVTDMKNSLKVNKLITNPRENYTYAFNKDFFINISSQDENSMLVNVYKYEKNFSFILGNTPELEIANRKDLIYVPKSQSGSLSSKYYEGLLDRSVTYVIIFNKIVKIK